MYLNVCAPPDENSGNEEPSQEKDEDENEQEQNEDIGIGNNEEKDEAKGIDSKKDEVTGME